MEYLMYVVPGALLISSLMGTWFLSRMIIKLDDRNKPILQEIMHSIEKTNEVSRKVDNVLVDGRQFRQHQQKLFEHDRVLLASLNSQVAKLDILMRVGSEGVPAPSNSPSGNPPPGSLNSGMSNQTKSSAAVASFIKLDSKSLPKTEQGITLLEQLFNRRQLAGNPEIIQRQKPNEERIQEQQPTSTSPNIPRKPLFESQTKDELRQKPQAPHQRTNPRSILNLFASETRPQSIATEQARRRA